MPKVWRFPPYDEAVVQRLAGDLKKPVLIAQVLAARGFENGDQANDFLSARLVDLHAPELLPGVPEATERIVAAVQAGRRITIYGDYDVDGVSVFCPSEPAIFISAFKPGLESSNRLARP